MELATLMTTIATLFASVIAYLAVIEMRKQRVVSHLPILKISNRYDNVDIDKNKNWKWEHKSLLINNYGKGVALDVSVKWKVEIKTIISMFEKYDSSVIESISLDGDSLKIENSFHFVDKQSKANFLALHVNTESSNITIPYYITALFEKYITEAVFNKFGNSHTEDDTHKFEDFPVVNIKAEYKDINENKYIKNFSLFISYSGISKSIERGDGWALVVFDVRETTGA